MSVLPYAGLISLTSTLHKVDHDAHYSNIIAAFGRAIVLDIKEMEEEEKNQQSELDDHRKKTTRSPLL